MSLPIIRRVRLLLSLIALAASGAASTAHAWGFEGHQVIAAVARQRLTPQVRAKVEAILETDTDPLTGHDLENEATWADRYRGAGHLETGDWHFVDIELDHPDLTTACAGFPAQGPRASRGPAKDCVVDKIDAFASELSAPATSPDERLLALKYLLHFVGDVHQPLHASDNHDRGGNCVLLALGGPRAVNLHSYWDTTVVQALGSDPDAVAADLLKAITPEQATAWSKGDAKAWAQESYAVAKAKVYSVATPPGCDRDAAPVSLPAGYAAEAQAAARVQLSKAGVRLAMLLNQALSR